jgi:hypothetical protein
LAFLLHHIHTEGSWIHQRDFSFDREDAAALKKEKKKKSATRKLLYIYVVAREIDGVVRVGKGVLLDR